MALSAGKTLQARVDKNVATRFALIARVRGVTESELVRIAIDDLMNDEENNIDALRAALRAEFEENERALLAAENGEPMTTAQEPEVAESQPVGTTKTAARASKPRARR